MMVEWIALGADVNDNELSHLLRMAQGELHRRFPSHGMTEEMDRSDTMPVDEFQNIICHGLVAHYRRMRRCAMIPLINGKHPELFPQKHGVRMPIVEGPEEAVENDKGRPRPV